MIKVFNSLTRQKEEIAEPRAGRFGFYVCGPTVYGPSHLGHAFTYINFDFIRRFLEQNGFKIRYVMNITDVHDDIIKTAMNKKIEPRLLAKKYTDELMTDFKTLKIKPADFYPRVSRHIPEIIKLIKILIEKGYAYETDDGVYFRVERFKDYGKLSHRQLDQAQTGTRVRTDKYDKEEAYDFALWKKEPNKKNSFVFKSPWGWGRPGWHIECSAMSAKYLKLPIDIHAGGQDLIFPHHENELAQSEAGFGRKFVSVYLHAGLLEINSQKMSKSLGNFVNVRDFLKKYPARFLRFFVLSHHYQGVVDFSEKNLAEAWQNYLKINEIAAKLNLLKNNDLAAAGFNLKPIEKRIRQALNDNFNTPLALAEIYEVFNWIDQGFKLKKISRIEANKLIAFFEKLDRYWLIFQPWRKPSLTAKRMMKEREKLRARKKYEEADAIRQRLSDFNLVLSDSEIGSVASNLN